jgi:uncharacterized protein (TIGR02145 family)
MEVQMKHIFYVIFLLVFCSISYSQNPCPGVATVDYGGKTYHTVQIGSQCWLKENLDIGTMINGIDSTRNNDTIEKFCYNNDPANCATYGGLYQWNEAMQYVTTDKTKGICPTGWHIPDTSEYTTLAYTVNLDCNALKAVGQGTGNGAGTNTSGFSALLAGQRYYYTRVFQFLGTFGLYWTSTEDNVKYNYALFLTNTSGFIAFTGDARMDWGYSVRCIKDASTGINDHSNNTLPNSIELFQNYPNPFNPSTTISYTLPEKSRVVLSIYNELGEKVAVLFNGEEEAGMHNIEWNASKFVSGVYFYELKTEKYQAVKKLSLMK